MALFRASFANLQALKLHYQSGSKFSGNGNFAQTFIAFVASEIYEITHSVSKENFEIFSQFAK